MGFRNAQRWTATVLIAGSMLLSARVAHSQANSWISPNFGKWETDSNWSLNLAPASPQAVFITNAFSKTVTIDLITAGGSPGTMTVSNLTVSAPAQPASSNTLLLNAAGTNTPLHVRKSLTVDTRGSLTIFNSALQVSGELRIKGNMVLFGGRLLTTNVFPTIVNTVIADTSPGGTFTVFDGTWDAGPVHLGSAGGAALGTLNIQGGTNTMEYLVVGSGNIASANLLSIGTILMTGGRLIVPANFTSVGHGAVGQMTVSNGTHQTGQLWVGRTPGSRGTYTVNGGTCIAGFSVEIGNPGATGIVTVSAGKLTVTNFAESFLELRSGTFTVSGGTVIANRLVATNSTGSSILFTAGTMTLRGAEVANSQQFRIGGTGQTAALNLVAGTNRFANGFSVGPVAGSTAAVWMTGGQLIVTNNSIYVGDSGVGQMIVSNGLWMVRDMFVGYDAGSLGTLRVAGGTNILASTLAVAFNPGSTGVVWVTGGQLIVTNVGTVVGEGGVGRMTVSNGTWRSHIVLLGDALGSHGTLHIAGGTNIFSSLFHVGSGFGSSGEVWQTGGELIVTNQPTTIGQEGLGRMTVSNGTWRGRSVIVGDAAGSRGTLTIAGGTNVVATDLILGNLACTSTGILTVTGGNLFVTNAVTNATLDVRSGTFTLNGGVVRVDRIIITNSCAQFVRTGGTLIYGSAVLPTVFPADTDGDGMANAWEQAAGLDPLDAADAPLDYDGDGKTNLEEFNTDTDPFDPNAFLRITSIVRTNNNQDILITWPTETLFGLGIAYRVQSGTELNGITNNLSPFIFGGSGGSTNYLDVGGATHVPPRFYRVRGLID